MSDFKKILYNQTLRALTNLGVKPDDEQLIKDGLNTLIQAMPTLTTKEIISVTNNAGAGKYGIPFKFSPALIGSWFFKERELRDKRNIGKL